MDSDKLKPMVIGSMAMVLGLTVAMSSLQSFLPPPPPAPDYYACPICHEEFLTYQELEEHFLAEHPSQPIEIIWT